VKVCQCSTSYEPSLPPGQRESHFHPGIARPTQSAEAIFPLPVFARHASAEAISAGYGIGAAATNRAHNDTAVYGYGSVGLAAALASLGDRPILAIGVETGGPGTYIRNRSSDQEFYIDDLAVNGNNYDMDPEVGWETYPISKVRVLLPWIALLAAIVAGAGVLVLRRRRAHI
jgi:hypothetical protein